MYLEQIIQFNDYITSLTEPNRFLMYLLIYVGLPLLCVVLLYIDKNIEKKKGEYKK